VSAIVFNPSSMKRLLFFSLLVVALSLSVAAAERPASTGKQAPGVRVLLVVAHPDDEYEMAGTVYRLAKEMAATVDQLIVTDGEAGYRYSSLAGQYYGVDLTNENVGRARLPEIRREEARRAAKVLGIKHQWFLNQKDEHFTLDADEVLNKSWNKELVQQAIYERLHKGSYDFLVVLLPGSDAHGEHKASSILAIKAAQQLPDARRPVILGAQAGGDGATSYGPLRVRNDSHHFATSFVSLRPRRALWISRLPHLSNRGGLGHRRAQVAGLVPDQVSARSLREFLGIRCE
jgi:LmbE family N-acetylglucosaminyl deacetylase